MKCEESVRLIHLNAGEELSASELKELREHLETCTVCASEARLVGQTAQFLKRLHASTPILARPEDLTRLIMKELSTGSRAIDRRHRRKPLDALLDVCLRPAVRYAYAALILFFVALFMIQQTDTLRSMEDLGIRLARSEGTLGTDIRFSIPVDEARKIIGDTDLEPLMAQTSIRVSDDKFTVRRSEIEPWTRSFSSRLISRTLASSETSVEQIMGLLFDLQKSVSSSPTLRSGGNNP